MRGKEFIELGWALFLLAFTTSLLIFTVHLHSDSLFLEFLAEDLWNNGGSWQDWRLTPAPAYFPDMLVYLLSYPFLPNAVARIFFVAVSQVVLLGATVLWVSKQLFPQRSLQGASALLIVIAFVTFAASQSKMWLYFPSTNNHFASLLTGLFGLGVLVRYYTASSPSSACWWMFLLFFTCVVGMTSTAVSTLSFWAPACLLTLLMLLFPRWILPFWSTHSEKVLKCFFVLVLAYGGQWLIEIFLTFHAPLTPERIPCTWNSATLSLSRVWQATKEAFIPDNKVTFSLSLTIAAAILFLIFKGAQRVLSRQPLLLNPQLQMGFLFLIIGLPINLCGVILSGGFVDPHGYRYLTVPLTLFLILAVLLLDRGEKFATEAWKAFLIVISSLILIPAFLFLKEASIPSPPAQRIAQCLEQQGTKLQSGISEYWTARPVSQHLPFRNQIVATFNDLSPFFWMSSLRPLQNFQNDYYNFVILGTKGTDFAFDYTADNLQKVLPPPTHVYAYPELKIEVWVYDDDALDKVVKAAFERFLRANNIPKVHQ